MALKLSKKQNKVKKVIKKAAPSVKRPAQVEVATLDPNINLPTGKYTDAIGRRKVATARVRIYESDGDFVVNNRLVDEYFATISNAKAYYNRPFELTNTKGKFSVTVKVNGSGTSSQLDAIIHGIARALVKFDPENRALLKTAGLLTRDSRMKETRKIGMGGKARRKRQSPKR
jgi:small subunit ribosomal protein S9